MSGDSFIVTDRVTAPALAYLAAYPCTVDELAFYLQISRKDTYTLLTFLERRKQVEFNFRNRKWESKR